MTPEPSGAGECDLCGGGLGPSAVEGPDGARYCGEGCRSVATALAPASESSAGDGSERADGATANRERGREDESANGRPGPTETTFLRVDGMHSGTCETFVERRAESTDGVHEAEASYVTETVRLTYDPRETDPDVLCERLTTLGYTALPRADVPVDPDATVDTEDRGPAREDGQATSRRDRERERERFERERSLDDLLGYRYAAAVLFASFLLIPYVVMVYPGHLGTMLDVGMLAALGERTGFGSGDGVYLLPFFLSMTGVVLLFAGLPLFRGALVSLRVRRPNTDLLVAVTVLVAVTYSTLAVVQGRTDVFYDATVVITAVVVAATFYESLVKREAMDRLTDLTVSRVRDATRYGPDGTTWTEPVSDLAPGDRVLVRQGERVPVDGTLLEGSCAVDEAVVTGESLPVTKHEGDDLVGGSVVAEGAAVLSVAEGVTSSLDRLTTAVWDVQSATHGVQRRADAVAGRVLPVVGVLGVLAGAAALVLGDGLAGSALAGLGVILVASPWAIGLATPLSVATSVRAALERGIVVFDETVFERLRDVDVVVFDKTGTLTTGNMDVREADAPPDLLAAAGALEERAAHPAAAAIASAFGPATDPPSDGDARTDGGDGVDGAVTRSAVGPVDHFETHATGVEGEVDGERVLVGAPAVFEERDWSVSPALTERVEAARDDGLLPVLVGREGATEGIVLVGDTARDGWRETLSGVAEGGRQVVVLTGDGQAAAAQFADHPDVDHVFAGIPPAGKTETIRRLQAQGRVAMVGDGTNDAPALAAADLGISLGGGTALAADAADVTIVSNDLGAVRTAFDLAGAAVERTRQTLWLSLGYNAVAIPAFLAGVLNPVTVAVGVALAGLLVWANCARPLV